jgi:hypothetical protein
LSQEQSLVERTHESPDDHRDAGYDADTTMWSSVLDGEQRQPQDRVLGALDEGHGNASAHLARVVKAEPLMGEMAATVDHELGTEHATECPPGDQRRHQRVAKAG